MMANRRGLCCVIVMKLAPFEMLFSVEAVDVNELKYRLPGLVYCSTVRFSSLEVLTDCGSYPAPPPSLDEKKTRRHPRRRVRAIDSVSTCVCHFL
jgi:hypothetical protein